MKVNLRNDVIFKYVFGKEKNERILKALLNAILDFKGKDKIKKITFLNPINFKEYLTDKLTKLDVKAEDDTGKVYNIEMQVRYESDYINRAAYYLAKLFTDQLGEAESYDNLNKAISISILDHIFFKEEPRLHNKYRFLNIESHQELTDIQEFHFIELPKFNKDKPRQLSSKFEKWLYALKFGEHYMTNPEDLPVELQEEEEIKMAIQEMHRASSDRVVREIFAMREKGRRDEISKLHNAKQEGKLEVAKNAFKEGLPIEIISKLTEFSIEKLEQLRAEYV